MRVAQSYELQTEINAFAAIRHIGYLAGIVAVALREKLGIMRPADVVGQWKSGLFETAHGVRHRIELVSHLDDDRLRACAHSWRVIGELAALEAPLTLTAVVIGAQRGGRRHSDWTRAYLHPTNRTLRFARRQSREAGFSDSWERVWREVRGEISTAKWLSVMRQDDVLDGLIVSREIAYRAEDNRMIQARREMDILAACMEGASDNSPMRRSSCDEWGGCSFATVCWSPIAVDPSQLPHLYQIRAACKPPATPEECTSEDRSAALAHPLPDVRTEPGLRYARI